MRSTVKESLDKEGYYIVRRGVDVTPEMVRAAKAYIHAQGGHEVVFNGIRGKNDKKRRQYPIGEDIEPILSDLMGRMKKKALHLTGDTHTLRKPVWLEAKSKTERQEVFVFFFKTFLFFLFFSSQNHCDDDPMLRIYEESATEVPLGVLLAMEKGARLLVFARSIHRCVQLTPTIIKLEPGDIVLFRCDLVHAGMDYEEPNIRFHAFLDTQHRRASASHKTFLPDEYQHMRPSKKQKTTGKNEI